MTEPKRTYNLLMYIHAYLFFKEVFQFNATRFIKMNQTKQKKKPKPYVFKMAFA